MFIDHRGISRSTYFAFRKLGFAPQDCLVAWTRPEAPLRTMGAFSYPHQNIYSFTRALFSCLFCLLEEYESKEGRAWCSVLEPDSQTQCRSVSGGRVSQRILEGSSYHSWPSSVLLSRGEVHIHSQGLHLAEQMPPKS